MIHQANNLIDKWLLWLCKKRGLTFREDFHFEGIIRWREIPFQSEEEYAYWWLPEIADGKIIREARMSEHEKDRYTVCVDHNIITTNGRTFLLTYVGSQLANTAPFAQFFAVGNLGLVSVNPGDTQLGNEIFRGIPASTTITGTQQDVATLIPSGQNLGQLTEAGLFGNGATGSVNSGTLMTHALSTFVKGPVNIVADYLLNIT